MKQILKISGFAAFLAFAVIISVPKTYAQDDPKLIEKYSLFSEYHKNKDYVSAVPYGWEVLQMDPQKFHKWIYFKMEDALWYLHDSSDIAADEKKAIEDSMINFYNMAIQYYPDQGGYFQARKAFVMESWLGSSPDNVIKEYETAISYNADISTYYYHRLGQLYKANMESNEEYKGKALDLYSGLAEKEPDNPQWNEELTNLVDNIDELVAIQKKAWELDKENLQKAWKYASMAIKANMFSDAIVPLEFLVSKTDNGINYWTRLAEAYQKTEQLSKAEDAYKKLIQLEPDNKNHYLNLGILFKDKGQLSAARIQYQKASDIGGNWGLPVFYEGLLYEQAARGCAFDLEAKKVYQLAVDTYRRAKSLDPSVAGQADDRVKALSSSLPTQEEWFFLGIKEGTTVPINGSCYSWIGKSIVARY
ncbi:MAG: tetratricopeptide repeat protein [Ignavibacteriaceae bacterium]